MCDGDVVVEANAQVLVTGKASGAGRNILTADDGSVIVYGRVDPVAVKGVPRTNPAPLF